MIGTSTLPEGRKMSKTDRNSVAALVSMILPHGSFPVGIANSTAAMRESGSHWVMPSSTR